MRYRVSTETLRRIAVALTRVPELPGTDLVLAAPDKKNATGSTSVAFEEGRSSALAAAE